MRTTILLAKSTTTEQTTNQPKETPHPKRDISDKKVGDKDALSLSVLRVDNKAMWFLSFSSSHTWFQKHFYEGLLQDKKDKAEHSWKRYNLEELSTSRA